MKVCKTWETKEVINFLTSDFILYGIPEKMKSDKVGEFISKEYKQFYKTRDIEILFEYTPNAHWERSGRKIDTNIEKVDNSKPRRRTKFNRMCKPSITVSAFHNTYGI